MGVGVNSSVNQLIFTVVGGTLSIDRNLVRYCNAHRRICTVDGVSVEFLKKSY